jgi:hypothetical protein
MCRSEGRLAARRQPAALPARVGSPGRAGAVPAVTVAVALGLPLGGCGDGAASRGHVPAIGAPIVVAVLTNRESAGPDAPSDDTLIADAVRTALTALHGPPS